MLAGRVSAGGLVSTTVTSKLLPDAGVQVTATSPSTRSSAVALKLTAAPLGPVASAVLSEGKSSEGGVVSTTVTSKKPVVSTPAESVTEQLTCVTPSGKLVPEAGEQFGVSAPS